MTSFRLLPISRIDNWQKRSHNNSQTSKLIFVGGIWAKSNPLKNLPPNRVSLDTAQIDVWVEITRMYLDKNTRNYLRNLGLKPKTIVEIVSKTATGSVIIRTNRQQIGLGAEIARRLVIKFIQRAK